jgi:hypothetical protein
MQIQIPLLIVWHRKRYELLLNPFCNAFVFCRLKVLALAVLYYFYLKVQLLEEAL